MSYFDHFAFGIYPYIAFAVMLIGSWIRYDREQYTWKTSSSQLLEKKDLRRGKDGQLDLRSIAAWAPTGTPPPNIPFRTQSRRWCSPCLLS